MTKHGGGGHGVVVVFGAGTTAVVDGDDVVTSAAVVDVTGSAVVVVTGSAVVVVTGAAVVVVSASAVVVTGSTVVVTVALGTNVGARVVGVSTEVGGTYGGGHCDSIVNVTLLNGHWLAKGLHASLRVSSDMKTHVRNDCSASSERST